MRGLVGSAWRLLSDRTIFPLDSLRKLAYTLGWKRRGAALSLRKSPTSTPAFLRAHRRNAQMSTGPHTRRGKSQSSMNRLKTGGALKKFLKEQKHLSVE